MMLKDFWHKSTVAVLGGGSWGSVLANVAAQNCREVRIWVRSEEHAREINSTRSNPRYVPNMNLHERVHAFTDLERVLEGDVPAIIWALPSSATREQARRIAPLLKGDEVILHATKGVEPVTLKRISQILAEELPCPRIGVISGPNLAHEVGRNEPAATVVASEFGEVIGAGLSLLMRDQFRVYTSKDVIGCEWAGTLKNTLAIAAGALDAMNYGWNARALLITRGLAEMVRFGTEMGGMEATFLGLAGIGDLLATCSSVLSRNYRVGARLAKGDSIETILAELGSTAEGVRTTKSVWEFAQQRGIDMPITEGVYDLLQGNSKLTNILHKLMNRPATSDHAF